MSEQSSDELLPLSLSVQTLGPVVVVTVSGELDLAGAPAVTAELAEAMTTACRRVVIDASGVTFLDAAGLRALRGEAAGGSEGVELSLRAPSRPVRRLLELTDLCGLIETSAASSAGEEESA